MDLGTPLLGSGILNFCRPYTVPCTPRT